MFSIAIIILRLILKLIETDIEEFMEGKFNQIK